MIDTIISIILLPLHLVIALVNAVRFKASNERQFAHSIYNQSYFDRPRSEEENSLFPYSSFPTTKTNSGDFFRQMIQGQAAHVKRD